MGLKAVHHIHLCSRDVDGTLAFARDFGLVPVALDGGIHYLRGAGSQPYLVSVERADASGMGALAFEVDAEQDLENAVRNLGATPIRPLARPGGGVGVSLRDPDGNVVELVHGVAMREPDVLTGQIVLNQATDKPRRGVFQTKTPAGPPQLVRLGHVGIFTTNMAAMHEWYTKVLGLLASDLAWAGAPQNRVAGFYRLDRGAEFVDHHSVALFGLGRKGIHHLSFEVQNPEVQFTSHRWLASRSYESIWGVGRHPKGSHVFDVWRDPAGFRFETFSDTDLLNASMATDEFPIESMQMDLWIDRSFEPYFA